MSFFMTQYTTRSLIQKLSIWYFSRPFFYYHNPTIWSPNLVKSILISRIFQLCHLSGRQAFCNRYVCSFKLSFINENFFPNIIPGKLNYYRSACLMCFIFDTDMFAYLSPRCSLIMLIDKVSVFLFWFSSTPCIRR